MRSTSLLRECQQASQCVTAHFAGAAYCDEIVIYGMYSGSLSSSCHLSITQLPGYERFSAAGYATHDDSNPLWALRPARSVYELQDIC